MIIDAHYHLEERMVPLDALLAQMDRGSVDRVAVIAALQDPFETRWLAENGAVLTRKLLPGRLHSLGLSLYRMMVTGDDNFSIFGKLYQIYAIPDNISVAHAVRAYPDRFYAWIAVNPMAMDPCAEVEKWADQPGRIGVKTHPFWHRYTVALLDELAGYCSAKGLPLVLHLGPEDTLSLYNPRQSVGPAAKKNRTFTGSVLPGI
jgi:uncharacterized protein